MERVSRSESAEQGAKTVAQANIAEMPIDFSVVLGGPTFQFLRRLRLMGDDLELLNRRLIIATMFTWLPLLLLIILGSAGERSALLSFVRDIEVHVRFLAALPVLIAGERLVHLRLRPIVRRFVERGIVQPQDLPSFYSSIKSAVRLRNSLPVEIGILIFVYCVGPWLTLHRIGLGESAWYVMPGVPRHLTQAGYWYVFVSIPVMQFLLVRWYFRLLIWFRFLWQASRLNLHLVPTHPDHSAGLGFLGRSAYAFSPILFAEGAMLAGLLASEMLYRGQSLLSFKWETLGVVVFFVLTVIGPLVMFTPKMYRAKRKGLADYAQLAQLYVDDFEKKWILGMRPPSEKLLGVPDIQSLADLGNSYSLVRQMRIVPFGATDIGRLAAATTIPLSPFLLTIFSADELFKRILRILF
jgi:hypothetical protein